MKTPTIESRKIGSWRRRIRLLAKLCLSLGALLVMFGVAELGLRIVGAKPRTATVLSGFVQPDANCGWIGRPSVSMRFTTSDFDVQVGHDQDGFRACGIDAPIESDAHGETETVWCVGDSTTWGFGVADDKGYVALLNQMSGSGVRYRNLGVPGFSSVQEYLLLKDRFERGEKPDEVIVLFATNDPADNLDGSCGSRPCFEIAGGEAEVRNYPSAVQRGWSFRLWLKQNSLAYNYFSYYLARSKGAFHAARDDDETRPADRQRMPSRDAESSVAETDEWIGMRAAYSLIKELCDEHGVPLTIAMPVHTPMVVQVCRELEIPLVDVSPNLSHASVRPDEQQPVHFPHDGHWNELGNRLVAEGLHAEFAKPRAARASSKTNLR